jgi:hypothetical protein
MSNNDITTSEELDALAVGSVVLDPHRMAWQKRQGLAVEWFAAGVTGGFARMALPFTVLHRPDHPSDPSADPTCVCGKPAGDPIHAGDWAGEVLRLREQGRRLIVSRNTALNDLRAARAELAALRARIEAAAKDTPFGFIERLLRALLTPAPEREGEGRATGWQRCACPRGEDNEMHWSPACPRHGSHPAPTSDLRERVALFEAVRDEVRGVLNPQADEERDYLDDVIRETTTAILAVLAEGEADRG